MRHPAATPAPLPSPLPTKAPADTIVYGQEPPTTAARPNDPVKIFAATITPSVWRPGATVAVSATTTTNATKVSIAYGTTSITLGQISPGHWQAHFAFAATAMPPGQQLVTTTLSASRIDGLATQAPLIVQAAI
jgi:hypothetical protein